MPDTTHQAEFWGPLRVSNLPLVCEYREGKNSKRLRKKLARCVLTNKRSTRKSSRNGAVVWVVAQRVMKLVCFAVPPCDTVMSRTWARTRRRRQSGRGRGGGAGVRGRRQATRRRGRRRRPGCGRRTASTTRTRRRWWPGGGVASCAPRCPSRRWCCCCSASLASCPWRRKTSAASCVTTSSAPSTPCCATWTDPRPCKSPLTATTACSPRSVFNISHPKKHPTVVTMTSERWFHCPDCRWVVPRS